jgi:hypothetical protein
MARGGNNITVFYMSLFTAPIDAHCAATEPNLVWCTILALCRMLCTVGKEGKLLLR